MKYLIHLALILLFSPMLWAQEAGLGTRVNFTFLQGGVTEAGASTSHATIGAEVPFRHAPGLALAADVGYLNSWGKDSTDTGTTSVGLTYHFKPNRTSKWDPFASIGYTRLFDRIEVGVNTITTVTTDEDLGDHFPPGHLKDETFSDSTTRFKFERTLDTIALGQDFLYYSGGISYWFHKSAGMSFGVRAHSPADGQDRTLVEFGIGVTLKP